MSQADIEQLRTPAHTYCESVEQQIIDHFGSSPSLLDAHVAVSDDVAKEIAVTANKTKSQLIYIGAEEGGVTQQFFRGRPIEQILRSATCDVAVYRGVE
ncbi:MAG: universal stress protein [Pirellulales bacterium]